VLALRPSQLGAARLVAAPATIKKSRRALQDAPSSAAMGATLPRQKLISPPAGSTCRFSSSDPDTDRFDHARPKVYCSPWWLSLESEDEVTIIAVLAS
jgi:hypothetical protein